MKKKTNRFLAMLLTIVMIVSIFPVSAFASETGEGSIALEGGTELTSTVQVEYLPGTSGRA